MNTYSIVDYRHLVERWFNGFLPDKVADKAMYVEEAGVVYLKSIPYESLKKGSLRFMLSELLKIIPPSTIAIVVHEPKPVNNLHLQPLLNLVEHNGHVAEANKLKILHLANRRYVPNSNNVILPQDRELEDFFDWLFVEMAGKMNSNYRFLELHSLPISDMVEVASSFFPKKALESIEIQRTGEIEVISSNDMLESLSSRIIKGKSEVPANQVERFKKALLNEIEGLV